MTFTKRILKSYKRKSSGCERYIRQPELLQIGGYEVKFVLFEFKSAGVEAIICTLLGDEVAVAATFDDVAVVEHHDDVGVLDRR